MQLKYTLYESCKYVNKAHKLLADKEGKMRLRGWWWGQSALTCSSSRSPSRFPGVHKGKCKTMHSVRYRRSGNVLTNFLKCSRYIFVRELLSWRHCNVIYEIIIEKKIFRKTEIHFNFWVFFRYLQILKGNCHEFLFCIKLL